ncbi:MAG: hypothetical protein LQ349_003966 [Xanthoria aureola]|nr:MAG: hypothetical protein LQ349_003966 [Xanthoria aureola]
MEALGLAASITALAEAAFKLVSIINTIKQGGKQRLRLFAELNSVWMLFKLLETHFDPDEQEIGDQWLETIKVLDEPDGVFDQVSSLLDGLTDRLQPKTGHRKVMQTLRWPFDKAEVEEFTAHLERLKSTINVAYNSTNSAVVREIQSDTKYIKSSVASDEVKAILDWMSNLNFLKQQADFVNQVREGTGEWFLRRADFQQWTSGREAMLWCPGIMGAGKTFLASIATEYLRKTNKDRNSAVLILYCGYNVAQSQSIDSLVAALIKQVLQLRPEISKELKELHKKYARTEVFPSLEALTQILRAELDKFEDCFIVVDGLDELLEESKRLLLLQALTYGKVNIMVTSRPLDSIRDLFGPFADVTCDGCDRGDLRIMYHCKQCLGGGFDLCEDCFTNKITCPEEGHYLIKRFGIQEIGIEATPSDIQNYVQWRIDHEPKLFDSVNKKKNLRDEISMTIVQQANGMFLLAKLHMDSLATKRTPRAVQLALQNLPTEIGDTYDQAMERIEATNEDDRKIVLNFLRWIVFSDRPLNVAEVEHASSITPETKDVDQDSILGAGELTSMCAGLVIIDASDIVRLVHFSAQSYFREHREKWFSNGHAVLARNCLTYLSYKAFKMGPSSGPGEYEDFQRKVEQYPLIDYSATYWGFHAAKSPNLADLTELIIDFLRGGTCSFAVQAMWYSDSSALANWDVRAGIHPMHLAAFFGLDLVVSKLLQEQSRVDCNDNLNTTPLMYAAAAGHVSVVQILLRQGADPNHSCLRGTTALHQAIIHDHTTVVQHLLNAPSIDVNAIDTKLDDKTPLMLAIFYGRKDIVPMILHSPRLDINMHTGQSMTTALSLAASYNHPRMIRQILAVPNIDVNKRDHWSTPLTHAATAGFVSVVEALLDHGADPEIQEGPNHATGTPLNRAIDYGHLAVVRLLLQRGANPRVLDTYNRTIIHSAAVNGQDETLRVLFEKPTGVDINAQGTNGRTALHDAAYFNYCSTITILFEHGARTDIHDGADRSPLGVAKDMNNLEALELLRKLRNQETTRDALNIGALRHTQTSLDSTQTGFLTAVKLGMKDVVKTYIDSSVSDPNVDINLADLDRHSALHIAVRENQSDILSMLIACPNIQINSLDRLERSALHWCALYCNYEAAELLLEAGADFTIKDHFSETALDIGLNARFVDTAMALLERGAMPKEQDMQHALHWAAEFGSVTVVERLVREGGADPGRKDPAGMTLLKLAEKGNNLGVVDAIVRLCEEREKN